MHRIRSRLNEDEAEAIAREQYGEFIGKKADPPEPEEAPASEPAEPELSPEVRELSDRVQENTYVTQKYSRMVLSDQL